MKDSRGGLSGGALGRATFEMARQNLEGVPSERIRSMSADDLAILAKVSKSALYQNQPLREWLASEHGREVRRKTAAQQTDETAAVEAPKARKDDHLFQQISTLQAQNSKLQAELAELRSKLARYRHIDEHLANTGRMPR
ncbi:hypothetical protein E6C67_30980 [Azospirillum sp. TSA2s]|uniref:hypothetical protein n=1 Tax=Azospirillum sp. TSA2s TaxID=709810 RepID=UPI0010AB1A74|nr:hypothetical protein [Azospirillum sp. TSA2s]QCG98117.1 hypothetical protein E6C67_30980 [Azospirillum sp. TSA2s]